MPRTDGLHLDAARLNERFENARAEEVVAWAMESIPRVAIACSFQLGGLILAHMARRTPSAQGVRSLRSLPPRTPRLIGGSAAETRSRRPTVDRRLPPRTPRRVPVLFLQTGFHFPETIEFRDRVVEEWGLDLIETTPTLGAERQAREIHPELYRVDPDACCHLNKVLPLQAALAELDGWVTGVRRDQAPTRTGTPVFGVQRLTSGREIWKVCPLARWTREDVQAYAAAHDIPRHPLYERGYASIGCRPCTRPVGAGEDERAGRWAGSAKTECGIHTA